MYRSKTPVVFPALQIIAVTDKDEYWYIRFDCDDPKQLLLAKTEFINFTPEVGMWMTPQPNGGIGFHGPNFLDLNEEVAMQ
jgi:hypothetical protein